MGNFSAGDGYKTNGGFLQNRHVIALALSQLEGRTP
jgi:hypothetical protein